MLIDTHCHLNSEEFLNDLGAFIKKAQDVNVKNFFVIGWDYNSSLKAIDIAHDYDCCYALIGIHPENCLEANNDDLNKIEELIKEQKVIGIGEIGLDYYWDKDETHHQIQKEYFIKQIELANKYNLPISIHARDALQDTLDILKNHPCHKGGIMHCYGGSKEMVNEFIKLGYKIGIGGVITFKNSRIIKEVVQFISLKDIVLETDCPYLTPVPHRGELNEPSYIPLILNEIAVLKEIDINEVETQTTENAKEVFGL